jgi:hypothetical protein
MGQAGWFNFKAALRQAGNGARTREYKEELDSPASGHEADLRTCISIFLI